MLVLIVPFTLLILYYFFLIQDDDWRYAWLETFVFFGTLATLMIELLSLVSQVHSSSLFISWLICNLIAILYLIKTSTYIKQINKLTRKSLLSFQLYPSNLKFYLYFILFVILLTGLLALAIPPTTVDALGYHLSRVMNWMQNQNVVHYPVNDLRQIDQPPGSSFIHLHLQSLSGGDLWSGMVQWFSMIGSVIGVSLIAREIGTSLRGQILASVFCVTLPLGILQASTSQNDYVVAFWLVCFVFGILWSLQQPNSGRRLTFTGLSVGLACLTKGTAYLYSLPLLLLFLVPLVFRRFKGEKINLPKILIILISSILVLNLAHWSRNYFLFNSFTGISAESTKNELIAWNAIISGIIRNFSMQLALPWQPFNQFIEGFIVWIHKALLHLDINDSRTTFSPGGHPFKISSYWILGKNLNQSFLFNENWTISFLHFILILITTLAYCLNRGLKDPLRSSYILALFIAFLMLSSLLKWQPSASRFQMSFFVLFAPFVGFVFSKTLKHKFLTFNIIFALLMINSLPFIFFGQVRHLKINIPSLNTPYNVIASRESIRWRRPFEIESREAIQALQAFECNVIALDQRMGLSVPEYALWAAFRASLKPHQDLPKLHYVFVSNASQKQETVHPSRQGVPCAVIVTTRSKLLSKKSSKKRVKETTLEYTLEDKLENRTLKYRLIYKTNLIRTYVLSEKL